MLYYFIKYILGPFILLYYRPKIYGREKLRFHGPAIVVCNHLSMADPLLLSLLSKRIIRYMAKSELYQTPLGKFFFRSLLAFPVNRHTADLTSLKRAVSVLEQGQVFGIFPEGTRSATKELIPLEHGAAFLALRTRVPVIPVYIHPDSYVKTRPRFIVGNPIEFKLDGVQGRSAQLETATAQIGDAFLKLRANLEAIEHADHHGA